MLSLTFRLAPCLTKTPANDAISDSDAFFSINTWSGVSPCSSGIMGSAPCSSNTVRVVKIPSFPSRAETAPQQAMNKGVWCFLFRALTATPHFSSISTISWLRYWQQICNPFSPFAFVWLTSTPWSIRMFIFGRFSANSSSSIHP